ncbi:BQ5605_C007g04455 [Microbotryum silenes-dioicae]|uniref:BQ5605_C007g04455 protein n=1 Tax=Microbotryum silenes-dioicae TaxID=796604 RepID=A0A2X0MB75_9BASI|nr:BQ5605_C007g04455 [Microbotryum silenes-dioicae]
MVRFGLVALTCAFATLAAAKNDPEKNKHHDLTPPQEEQDGTPERCFARSLKDVMNSWELCPEHAESPKLNVSRFLKCACTNENPYGNGTYVDKYFNWLTSRASHRQ